MDRIARIDRQTWNSGTFLDQEQQTAPLWVDSSNVMFQNDTISVFPGAGPLFTKDSSNLITGLCELSPIVLDAPGLLYGTHTELKCWDETNGIQSLGSGYTGIKDSTKNQVSSRWSLLQFNEWLMATNGQDPMQLCKVIATGFADMTSDTSTQFKYAEIIKKYRQFVLAFNLKLSDGTRQGNAFACCDVNDPETWVPASTNSARKFYMPHLKSDILNVTELGEDFICYTVDGSYVVSYAGYPDVFSAKPLHEGIGVFGKNCVCEVKGRHVGYGPRGLWAYDGNSYEYIDSPPLRKYLRDNLNVSQADKIVLYNDRTLQHMLMFFPGPTSLENNMGVAWNYIENKFTPLVFSRSAAVDTGQFDRAITADFFGNVYKQSLDDIPAQDTANYKIEITSEIQILTGYGERGYGEGGYGGYGG